MNKEDILSALDLHPDDYQSGNLDVTTPIDGSVIGKVQMHSVQDAEEAVSRAKQAFLKWRKIPAPVRGEFVRLLGLKLREKKDELARLVTLECGKIFSEGQGEVQEMIDICDLAVGQSRQLYGLTMPSERPGHTMREVWHPVGPVAVISAFNFPVAVWAWNAALALVCGNPVIWKPSEKTPFTALACQKMMQEIIEDFKKTGHEAPEHLSQLLIGGADIGDTLAKNAHIPLVSATGSTRMGKAVLETVSKRMGRTLLELGGNNAAIICPSADFDMALSSIAFGACGTAGQRCTTLRRLFLHEEIKEKMIEALIPLYKSMPHGSPLDQKTLIGPLIDEHSYQAMQNAIEKAKEQGGKVLIGGEQVFPENLDGGFYVRPALIEMPGQTDVVKEETFAPILYVMTYRNFEEAIEMHNAVPQGLSSCVFTENLGEAETFLSYMGSDCGIANVNIGSSGAEVGGAFGGEKETGGGRECGSDVWKTYMRRQTQTINFMKDKTLAQGVRFDVCEADETVSNNSGK